MASAMVFYCQTVQKSQTYSTVARRPKWVETQMTHCHTAT